MKKVVLIPIAIAVVVLLAFATTGAYRVPTLEVDFLDGAERPANISAVEYEVKGLKCRGMAGSFSEQIKGVPGVVSFVAYARTHTAIVEFDPTLTDPDAIREAFEKPIEHEGEIYELFATVSQIIR